MAECRQVEGAKRDFGCIFNHRWQNVAVAPMGILAANVRFVLGMSSPTNCIGNCLGPYLATTTGAYEPVRSPSNTEGVVIWDLVAEVDLFESSF